MDKTENPFLTLNKKYNSKREGFGGKNIEHLHKS